MKKFSTLLALSIVCLSQTPSFADDGATESMPGINPNYGCTLKAGPSSTPVSVPDQINFPVNVAVSGVGSVRLISKKPGTVIVTLFTEGTAQPTEEEVSTSQPYLLSVAPQGQPMVVLQCKTNKLMTSDNGASSQAGAAQIDKTNGDVNKIVTAIENPNANSGSMGCIIPGFTAPATIGSDGLCQMHIAPGGSLCCPASYQGFQLVQTLLNGVDACCALGYPSTQQYCIPLSTLLNTPIQGCSMVSQVPTPAQTATPVTEPTGQPQGLQSATAK